MATQPQWPALPSVTRKERIGFTQHRKELTVFGEEQSVSRRRRLDGCAKVFPFGRICSLRQQSCDRRQYPFPCKCLGAEDAFEPHHVDEPPTRVKPVEHFVEQARIVPANRAGKQQQRLGVNNPVIVPAGLTGHAECRPLPPEEIQQQRLILTSKCF